MNGEQFQMVIHELNKFHNPKIQTKAETDDWWRQIKELDGNAAYAAAKHLSDTDVNGYMPPPAKLKSVIEDMLGTKRISATEAWLIARGCVSRYTTREKLEALPDDIRKAMREAGGSAYLGEQPEYRAQKAFESAWNAMGDTVKREQVQRIGSGMKLIGG